MKPIRFSPDLVEKIRKIRKKDRRLFVRLQKQMRLFQLNPKHRSLRLHKLKGNLRNVWSLSVDRGYRLVYVEGEEYYFFDLGTHDEVYKR